VLLYNSSIQALLGKLQQQLDHKALRVLLVPQVLQEPQALRVPLVLLVLQVLREPLVPQVLQVLSHHGLESPQQLHYQPMLNILYLRQVVLSQ
jgi:hypothetical protein